MDKKVDKSVENWTDMELRKVLRVFLELVLENRALKAEIARLSDAGFPASVPVGVDPLHKTGSPTCASSE